MKATRILRECDLFAALADSHLDRIAELYVERQYEPGATLFREGDRAEELFVVRQGKVALQMAVPGDNGQASKRMTVDIVGTNEALGWSAIVEPHMYTLTAVCLQGTKALAINGSKLTALFQDDHHIGYAAMKGLIKVVASRLDDTRRVLVSERLWTLQP